MTKLWISRVQQSKMVSILDTNCAVPRADPSMACSATQVERPAATE